MSSFFDIANRFVRLDLASTLGCDFSQVAFLFFLELARGLPLKGWLLWQAAARKSSNLSAFFWLPLQPSPLDRRRSTEGEATECEATECGRASAPRGENNG